MTKSFKWQIVEVYKTKQKAERARQAIEKRLPYQWPTMVRKVRIGSGEWRWALYRKKG